MPPFMYAVVQMRKGMGFKNTLSKYVLSTPDISFRFFHSRPCFPAWCTDP